MAVRNPLIPFLVAVGIVGPFAFAPVSETDVGWHLAVGRWVVQHGSLTRNALSWTYPDFPCRSTSWLFDPLLFLTYARSGVWGIQALTFAFVAATLAALALACVKANPHGGAWAVPVTAALLLPRQSPRAFLCSWLLLALCTALGVSARRSLSYWTRAACVPLIALFSNFHSGALFGAVALGVYCAEAAYRSGRWRREFLTAAAGALALLCNPGGLHNLLYAAHHLWLYDSMRLSELQSPTLLSLPAFYALAAVCLGLAWLRRKDAPGDVLLCLGFALGGMWTARVAFDFDIVAAPVLAAGVPVVLEKYGKRAQSLLITLLAVLCIAPNVHRAQQLHPAARWDEKALPVRATRFIQEHQLAGPLFNSFDEGGYLAFALPELPVFQDGRTQAYPPEFFMALTRAGRTPEGFDAYLRNQGVTWALTQTQDRPGSGSRLLEVPGWALVYWDEQNEVLLRRDVPLFKPLIAANEYLYFHPLKTDPTRVPENVAALARPALEQYLLEVKRFEASTPDDPYAALAHCALGTRLRLSTAPGQCTHALRLHPDMFFRKLVQRAQSLSGA